MVMMASLLAVPAAAGAAAKIDYAQPGSAFQILAPGEWGGLPLNDQSTDQLKMYDALTPLRGNVTQADLEANFISERFGAQGPGQTVEPTPQAGLTVTRDRYGVAHIYGKTRSATMFGVGWVAYEDRGLLMDLGRGPARVAMLDVPGINAFGLVTSVRSFTPTKQADAFVHKQVVAFGKTGKDARQVRKDFQDWVAGVNAQRLKQGKTEKWTEDDAFAAFAFIGSIFGNGGGDEARNGAFLASLQAKYGKAGGLKIFRDLRQINDPDAATSIPNSFPYETAPKGATPGSPLPDPGSQSSSSRQAAVAALASRRKASNALLVGASRSATGHPFAVMGPQLGYYYPEIMMQVDIHGGGIDASGALPPVQPYILIGRGKDYSWSLTSAGNDNTDQFLEQLCEPGGGTPTRASTHYVYKGKCRAMTHFDAGLLAAGGGEPARELEFNETVHGPVSGTVLVKGKPYAVSRQRATRGRDPNGSVALLDLNENRVHNPKDFFKAAGKFETTFNWHYADDKNIAYFSSGLLPIRAKGTDPSLPTLGTGKYDWKGWLPVMKHPHAANPKSGIITNWNNKPAPGWGAADSNYDQGSVQRVEGFVGFKKKNQLADVVGVMNSAASRDLRASMVWPDIAKVLKGGPAPRQVDQQAAALIDAWITRGADRLDRDLDGKIDDPGAAVLDTAWPDLSRAILRPVLGDLLGQFESLNGIDNKPGPGGSSFGGGWYSYIDKDLRTQLGEKVKAPYSRKYCGGGDVAACRAALWAAIGTAVDTLTTAQGADPAAWRSDATKERIKFPPGLLPDTMRWTNRPTFQQAISYNGHRPGR